jgi:predicted enzyme related to lactoylglutathione lyase
MPQAIVRLGKLGAKVVLPKMDQNGHGWFANLVDVEGHRFGIFQYKGKDATTAESE